MTTRPSKRRAPVAAEEIRVGSAEPDDAENKDQGGGPAPGGVQDQGPSPEPIQETGQPENQESGRTAGNPETQETGKPESRSTTGRDGDPEADRVDYLGAVFGGVTDPDEDFVKFSAGMPLYEQRTLKAAAAMEGTSVQKLLAEIIVGKRASLDKSHPEIVARFYKMAQRGELRR